MKPEDEALARIRAAVKRGDQQIDLGAPFGIPLTMVKSPDGRFEVRRSDTREVAVAQSTVWEPAPTRPVNYPADLPFLPDLRAVVVTSPEVAMATVQWFNPPEPQEQLRRLVEESRAQGWESQPLGRSLEERPGEHHQLARGDAIRVISLVGRRSDGGILSLIQRGRT